MRRASKDVATFQLDRAEKLQAEVERLKEWVNDLQSGMYVNCVYCGHRYGPGETTPVSMADALKAHVEQCPRHPMSSLKADLARVRALEAECEGHKEAFARMLAEAELCGSVNEDLQARVAALEEALRGAMKKLQRYGEQTEDESAALARPTPTPQGEQG